MKLSIYQADAFTEKLFGGNPAAVIPLTKWLPDDILQSIAAENNLAETAFYIANGSGYHLRWFTPAVEVDLCGHATLASAYVLFNYEDHHGEEINFDSRSGVLKVRREGDLLTLDFPAYELSSTEATNDVIDAIGKMPVEVYSYKNDLLLVYHDSASVEMLKPDFRKLAACRQRAVLVTGPGNETDYVYRFFTPKMAIDEDPATGSAQCALMPYWTKRLNKNSLSSLQVSRRKGYFTSTLKGDRVEISGRVIMYMKGEIEI
jgi:PhzF family phenazine biosynthesis protein